MLPEAKVRLLKYLYDALLAAEEIEKRTLRIGVGSYQFSNIT